MRPTMPRLLLLLFGMCMTSMLFISRCGINFESPMMERRESIGSLDTPGDGGSTGTQDLQSLQLQLKTVQQRLQDKDREIQTLKQTVENLKMQLQEARSMASDLINKPSDSKETELYYHHFIQDRIKISEITKGVFLKNEFELVPFCRFTLSRIYLVDPGMGKRVVEKPIGYKKRDILEAVAFGLTQLNDGRPEENQYTGEDFFEGIYRTEPSLGSHYELYFRDLDNPQPTNYRKVVVTRPYAPLHLISQRLESTRKELINIILPLSGRVDKFDSFMLRFRRVGIAKDRRIHLTVVYFGQEGLQRVKDIIARISKEARFPHIKLVTLTNEEFSRGRGLQVGAQSWDQGDVLMFLCDVDIVFSTDFLERCRLNAERGQRVYYPMVFSLYNPRVVYALQDMDIPPAHEQLIISKDAGFWRDFGFGMTCQYRSDFLRIKGFDEQITGWGLEDVHLYRKYVKSNLMVVRATDPGIFHLWHEKYCEPQLPSAQYRGCIRSKALNEASHAQLGMLAFKEEIDVHMNLLKKKNNHGS